MAIKWTIILLGSILVNIQYTHPQEILESTETNGTTITSSTMVPQTSPSSTETVMTTSLATVMTSLPTSVTISIPTTLTANTTAPKDEDVITQRTEPTTQTSAQTSLVTATTDSQTSPTSETDKASTVLPIDKSSPAPLSPTITVPLPSSVSPTVTPNPTSSSTLVSETAPAPAPETTSNAPSTSHTTQQSTEAPTSSVPETSVPTTNTTQILPEKTSSTTSNPATSLPTSTASPDLSSSTTATKQVHTKTSEVDSKLKLICQTLKELMKTEHCSFITKGDDKQHILIFTLDDGELTTSTMAPPPSSKRPTQIEEKNEEMNRDTLISILASCGALVLILCCFAVYCTYHRRSYRKNQQHLTEELQTVENGYHDNPTLEVMEVQPEMQEKKMALNGEFNDSWIVPIDNLLKDDMPDEEDTHL